MFKAGDKVKCINTGTVRGSDPSNLTVGKVYEVRVDQTEDLNVNVIDNSGNSRGFFPERFEVYEEPKATTLDLTKPIETRDGQSVTLELTAARGDYPLKGYVGDDDNLYSWTVEGKHWKSGAESEYDIRNVAPKPLEREIYLNVYKDNTLSASGSYATRWEADRYCASGRIGVIKVKLVEGQFDA